MPPRQWEGQRHGMLGPCLEVLGWTVARALIKICFASLRLASCGACALRLFAGPRLRVMALTAWLIGSGLVYIGQLNRPGVAD